MTHNTATTAESAHLNTGMELLQLCQLLLAMGAKFLTSGMLLFPHSQALVSLLDPLFEDGLTSFVLCDCVLTGCPRELAFEQGLMLGIDALGQLLQGVGHLEQAARRREHTAKTEGSRLKRLLWGTRKEKLLHWSSSAGEQSRMLASSSSAKLGQATLRS